jgi:hypothetical protein
MRVFIFSLLASIIFLSTSLSAQNTVPEKIQKLFETLLEKMPPSEKVRWEEMLSKNETNLYELTLPIKQEYERLIKAGKTEEEVIKLIKLEPATDSIVDDKHQFPLELISSIEFQGTTIANDPVDQKYLITKTRFHNISANTISLPNVRISLHDQHGYEVYSELITPEPVNVESGKTAIVKGRFTATTGDFEFSFTFEK